MFKAFGDMRIKWVGKKKMCGRMIGFLHGAIMLRDFFKCACKPLGMACHKATICIRQIFA